MSGIYVTQAGFALGNDSYLNRYIQETFTFREQILNRPDLFQEMELYYHPRLTDLASQLANQPAKLVESFELRDEVFKCAYEIFGKDMGEFVEHQTRSKFFSTQHEAFLKDTALFLCSGKRQLSITQWGRLVDSTNMHRAASFNHKAFFGPFEAQAGSWIAEHDRLGHLSASNGYITLGKKTSDLLSTWASADPSLGDLFLSLWVIAGRRRVNHSSQAAPRNALHDVPTLVNPAAGT